MKWLPIAALLLSGCVTTDNVETSSTSIIPNTNQDTIVAPKEVLPISIPARFICKSRESIIAFVNVDMFKKGRTIQQQNLEFQMMCNINGDCFIFPQAFQFTPTERVLRYTDQQGMKSSACQVQFDKGAGYIVSIDQIQNQSLGLPI